MYTLTHDAFLNFRAVNMFVIFTLIIAITVIRWKLSCMRVHIFIAWGRGGDHIFIAWGRGGDHVFIAWEGGETIYL